MKRFQFVTALFLVSAALLNSGALATDILTNRGDNARTGFNPYETILTPANVSSSSFGLLYNQPVDGQVYAQPLYVSNQTVVSNGQTVVANVLYVATEHDSLYAFDADTGAQLWQVSLLGPGERPVSYHDVANCDDLLPEIGITATPVIDRNTQTAGPHGTIFVLVASADMAGNNFFHRLHAIDLATGADRITPAVIAADVSGNGPQTHFYPVKQRSRAGLLLLNGNIYTAWSSYCDFTPYAGWIIVYNENLQQVKIFTTDPNGTPANSPTGTSGNTIWQGGNGPAVDSAGNIYVATANGPFSPALGDYGDSVLKLPASLASVSDYFTPFDQQNDADQDLDLGSCGPIVLPDILDSGNVHHHLLVQSGKDGNLYLLNRDNLGKFQAGSNSQIYQELPGVIDNGAWTSPAYFNGSIYLGGINAPLKRFQFNSQAKLNPASSSTPNTINYPGATPTISANGTSNAIVWAYEASSPAVLHAYDPANLANVFLDTSSINFGDGVKFAVPTVCNGKVFVGTANSIAAFGLRGPGPNWHVVAAADFNGDGRADLVWENRSNGQRSIWILNADGSINQVISLGVVSSDWHIAGVGDFLANGQSDLVWENTVTGQRAIWIMNNGVFVRPINLGNISTDWHIVGAGDFNSDGQADLVWENSSNGLRAIWIMNNGQFAHAVINLGAVSTAWHIAGVGDFLGNGQSGLVWENKVGGTRAIWIMNNGQFVRSMNLGVVSTKWHISCAGDINGDGHADLIWENSSVLQRAIWIMNTDGSINQVQPIQ